MCTFYDKENYVHHIRLLQQALKHGVILRKVHWILKFNQSKQLESYIISKA